MKSLQSIGRLLPVSSLALVAAISLAQAEPAKEYQPSYGQAGKDVVWVPTNQALVDTMLNMAKVTASDFVIDLGSGDGRTVITAAKRGARALGIEYNPDMVALATRNAAKEGVSDKAKFVKADIFESDFSQATVITLFLLPQLNIRLRPKLLEMKPGVRVASNTFDMEDWKPDQRIVLSDCPSHCTALLWIVPAKVQGKWKMPHGEFELAQKFQVLTGTMKIGNISTEIRDGKMNGDQIAFSVGSAQYLGRVNGKAIEGTVKAPIGVTKWQATRAD